MQQGARRAGILRSDNLGSALAPRYPATLWWVARSSSDIPRDDRMLAEGLETQGAHLSSYFSIHP